MNIFVHVYVLISKINNISSFFYMTWYGIIYGFFLTTADYFLNSFGWHLVVSCYLCYLTFVFVGCWGCL